MHAVGLVHRRLYRGDQIHMINTARYIEELCADATSSMGQEWEQYLSLDLAPMTLSTDRAVTLGLGAHRADHQHQQACLCRRSRPDRNPAYRGAREFPAGRRRPGRRHGHLRKGFGTRMVDALVAQLGGQLVHEANHPGLRAVLTAPIASRAHSM